MYVTLSAIVGFGTARTSDTTVGGDESIEKLCDTCAAGLLFASPP